MATRCGAGTPSIAAAATLAIALGMAPGCVPDAALKQAPSDAGESAADSPAEDAAALDATAGDMPADAIAVGPGTDGSSPATTGDGSSADSASRGDEGSDSGGESGGPAVDGGGEPVTCGAARCYAGQSCQAGSCAFPCAGVHVPGDYATVQAAIDAVSAAGGTICVGAGTFRESLRIATASSLVLQGLSPAQSAVGTVSFTVSGSRDVTLRGVSIGQLVASGGSSTGEYRLSVIACALGSNLAAGFPGLDVVPSGGALTVTLDGADVSSNAVGAGYAGAVEIEKSTALGASLDLVVRNSYLHDSQAGVDYAGNGTTASMTVTLVNDTFASDGAAIHVVTSDPGVSLRYYDDLIVNGAVGVDVLATPVQRGNNALFANTTSNYADDATGPGDILSDPMLDRSTLPPGLLPGSPCRGAGDPSQAPATDFWGRARGANPDIGAVQSSP